MHIEQALRRTIKTFPYRLLFVTVPNAVNIRKRLSELAAILGKSTSYDYTQ